MISAMTRKAVVNRNRKTALNMRMHLGLTYWKTGQKNLKLSGVWALRLQKTGGITSLT